MANKSNCTHIELSSKFHLLHNFPSFNCHWGILLEITIYCGKLHRKAHELNKYHSASLPVLYKTCES